jgi:hypothetical protein
LGVELPEGIAIQVVQETPTTIYLVVPPRPDTLPEGQLTDADLATVAGGWSGDRLQHVHRILHLRPGQLRWRLGAGHSRVHRG